MEIVLSADAKKRYFLLQKKKMTVKLRALGTAFRALRNDVVIGNPVAKRLFPKKYAQYELRCLFRSELPQHWRMLYTIRYTKEKVAFVLDILSHKEYNRLFGYKS